MRIILICLLVILILFTGQSIYYRSQADSIMARVLHDIPNAPAEAYRNFKPLLEFNNLLTLGKVGSAKQAFLKKMEAEITQSLDTAVPAADYYLQARQALQALADFEKTTSMDTKPARKAIVQRAKDSMTRVRDRGTLAAWDGLLALFDDLNRDSLISPGVFDDYDKWIAEVKAVDRRPLGLRNAIDGAAGALRDALNHLGMMPTPEGGAFAAPAPLPLDDPQLIAAEKSFTEALGQLDQFKATFRETQLPPELKWLQAKIEYDKGAIKLAHLQERGAAVKATGSNYIAELMIVPNTTVVPSTPEMVGAFINGTQGAFEGVEQMFPLATTVPDASRRAGSALAAWADAQLLTQMGGGDPAAARARAESWIAGVGEPAAAVGKAMHDSPRALIITQVP